MGQSITAMTPRDEARRLLAEHYDLTYTKAVATVTARIRDKVGDFVAEDEWPLLAPLIVHINRLKGKKGVAILADYHQAPALFAGVADRTGDDLQLIRDAARVKPSTLLVAAATSLAQTIKLAAPRKRVLAAAADLDCTLSKAITLADIEAIRAQYREAKLLAHVNSALAVKAVADLTFTAANAIAAIDAAGTSCVIMVPDQYLARNTARRSDRKVVTWAGSSDSYGGFTGETVNQLRAAHPGIRILAHPQNPPEVAALADITGSLLALVDWLKAQKPALAAVLADDAVTANLAPLVPDTRLVAPGLAAQPARVSLEQLLWTLHSMSGEVRVPPAEAKAARPALERMLALATETSSAA